MNPFILFYTALILWAFYQGVVLLNVFQKRKEISKLNAAATVASILSGAAGFYFVHQVLNIIIFSMDEIITVVNALSQ